MAMLALMTLTAFAEGNKENRTENTNAATPTWEFFYSVAEPTEQQLAEITDNTELGKKSAFYLQQLQSLCVKRIPVVPGDPTTRTVIKKGDLFNAVRKVSKGLEADVRSHKLSEQEGESKMTNVLSVAISAFYSEDSQSFEKALRANKKDYKQLMEIFSRVMLR